MNVFTAVAPAAVMAQWKRNIRTHYPELLKKIDTKNGLEGELKKLQSASFPLRAINRIWVIIYYFNYLYIFLKFLSMREIDVLLLYKVVPQSVTQES